MEAQVSIKSGESYHISGSATRGESYRISGSVTRGESYRISGSFNNNWGECYESAKTEIVYY